MSHPLVAAVWEQLGRRDLANLLREIIGEHAADIAVSQIQDGAQPAKTEALTQSVFWIRAIFDLQRTYLQGLRSIHGGHSSFLHYLLPSEVVLSAVMYLVQVKTSLFPCTTPTAPEVVRYRHFLVHTLLAGIRLLLLRGENLSPDVKFNMERVIRSAWQDPDLSSVERYLVSDLLPKAISSIGSPELCRSQSPSTLGKAQSAAFVSGMYPFSGTSEPNITDLLTALINNKTDQLIPFCLLFDMLWATESALVQCHIDRRRISQEEGHSSDAAFQVDEAFNQAREIRMRLAKTILAAFNDEFTTPSLQVLATAILSQNGEGQPPLQTRRIRDSWAQLSRLRDVWESSLGYLVRWLINRRVQLWGCNGELEANSHYYQQHLAQWLQSSPLPENSDSFQATERRSDIIYVVNCPAVHLIPRALLEEQLRSFDRNAHEQLKGNLRFLTTNISCPLCPGSTKIQYARMIEPLDQVSTPILSEPDGNRRLSLQGSISRNTTSSSSVSHSASQSSGDALKSPITPGSYTAGLSEATSIQSVGVYSEGPEPFLTRPKPDSFLEKQMSKVSSRELKSVKLPIPGGGSLFRRGSSKETKLPQQPRFCFSASGRCLLLWGAGGNCLVRFDIPSIEGQRPVGHKYDVTGVQYAAAGDRRCAIIATVGEHYELLVFNKTAVIPEAYLSIEIQHHSLPPISMVMSRDDRYIAFTFKDEVRFYEVGTRSIRRVSIDLNLHHHNTYSNDLATGTSPAEGKTEKANKATAGRKIQFSVDGKNLIVATHLGDQDACVEVWNCSTEQWNVAPDCARTFKLSPWSANDKGLTCVFYDSFHHAVLLTALPKKDCSASSPVTEESNMSDHSTTTIIHAAQSPSGSRFVIANGMNQICLCNANPSGALKPSRTKKASNKISPSVFKPGKLVLSFPQDDWISLFWIKQGRLLLRMVRLNEGNETVSEYDLRSDFDRLLLERLQTTGSPIQHRRYSLLSNQPITEMDNLTLSPRRPNMPELPST
ncbi:hypothetical protein EYZ11_003999 [Aspergillus tanneri]|uniref:Uncharacterized protein n=1 Tax=Aspergillus tanneri TaxID=1220188 RepID=A0A4S3JM61_9EURO|nr:hypothetical protein EYZ11_003999 [Aspergillus tanneri]